MSQNPEPPKVDELVDAIDRCLLRQLNAFEGDAKATTALVEVAIEWYKVKIGPSQNGLGSGFDKPLPRGGA